MRVIGLFVLILLVLGCASTPSGNGGDAAVSGSGVIVYIDAAGWTWGKEYAAVDRVLRRQFGVAPQLSIKDRVVWMEWPVGRAFELGELNAAIESGSLQIRELRLIGEFIHKEGAVSNEAFLPARPIRLDGTWPATKTVTLLVQDHKNANRTSYSVKAVDALTPKQYQPVEEQPSRQ